MSRRPPSGKLLAVDYRTAKLSQHDTPVVDGLRAYREHDYLPFHMPGHKRGLGAHSVLKDVLGDALDLDLCLTPGFEDSRQQTGYLDAAERLAAEAWGCDRAFFLTNGSSGGLQTLVLALAPEGSAVIAPRNAHKALLGGLILSGARPVYVEPEVHPEWGVALNVPAARFTAALQAVPHAASVFVSSPGYNGCCADIPAVVQAAHRVAKVVAVDQAWGPHLPFCSALPEDALSQGADVIVTSIHKLISGMSQASLIAAQGTRLDLARLATLVDMLRSTSMLVPILASIDAARMQMATEGEALWSRAVELAEQARAQLTATPGLRCMGPEILQRESVHDFDRTRLTVSAADLGWAGFELEWELREHYHIAVEAADSLNIVMNITHADTGHSTDRLVGALREIAGRGPLSRDGEPVGRGPAAARAALSLALPPSAQPLVSPREAFFSPSRTLPLRDCVGAVSAEMVTPYPPGIPVLGPGEPVTQTVVAFLEEVRARGLVVHGPHDPSLATLRTIADKGAQV